jgi:hypothetical protein
MKEYPALNGESTAGILPGGQVSRFIEGPSPQHAVSEETAHPTHENQPFEERLEGALRDENRLAYLHFPDAGSAGGKGHQ